MASRDTVKTVMYARLVSCECDAVPSVEAEHDVAVRRQCARARARHVQTLRVEAALDEADVVCVGRLASQPEDEPREHGRGEHEPHRIRDVRPTLWQPRAIRPR